MKLSIIIPVYNVEKFIDRCINSCLNQKNVNIKDYEIIIIDDGSPDCSGEMAEFILKDIPNSTIIHQENQGLSGARNTGINASKGDYIWFVDSDDWISANALECIFKAITENDYPDVIMIRAISENSYGKTELRHNNWADRIELQSGIDVFISGDWLICAQFFIVRKQLLERNNIRFMRGIFHEDNEYTPRILYFAKSVVRINEILYHSFVNTESITHSINPKRAFDLIKVCDSLSNFTIQHKINGILLDKFNDFISLSLNNAFSLILPQDKIIKNNFNKELSKHPEIFKILRKSTLSKYRMEGFIFLCFKNYIAVYSLLLKFKSCQSIINQLRKLI